MRRQAALLTRCAFDAHPNLAGYPAAACGPSRLSFFPVKLAQGAGQLVGRWVSVEFAEHDDWYTGTIVFAEGNDIRVRFLDNDVEDYELEQDKAHGQAPVRFWCILACVLR